MSTTEGDYNRRQFRLMLRRLEQYRAGALGLAQLVGDLEALGDALESPTESWRAEFEPAWGMLEDVHASLLVEGRTEPGETERVLIERAVGRLTALLESELARGP